jgi:NAD(P)-dependent dehydrogenase (short-subunit alcohol dehydrogenase family)
MDTTKTILITGATTGIGRHAALHLAALGHHVIATGRNPRALDELRAAGAAHGRVDVVLLDVTDGASIEAARAEVERLTGGRGVDVLVNNAGYGLAGAMAEVTDADLRAQFETNVFGLMAVTRAFLPPMLARRDGRIINVSSIAGRVSLPMFGAYHGTKHAVEAMSDALRMELAPLGVQVALVEPGPIKTEFGNRTMREIAKYRSEASPWAAVYRRADQIATESDRRAFDPIVVSRAIAHAATARRARARYLTPGLLGPLVFFGRLMPARIYDFILSRALGLTRAKLAPASAAANPPPVEARAA